jgi:hypothetical protein
VNPDLRTHKHRIPTYSEVASLADPGAWGDSTDALAHDRLVLGTLVRAENDAAALIEALEAYLPTLRDDAYYWQVLLAMWVKNGRSEYADRYRRLFEARRRNRFRGMKKADRRAWRALPDPVRVYRAIAPGEPPEVFSWTLDPERIRHLYPDREIVERMVPKAEIAFYVDRRKEREVIIL